MACRLAAVAWDREFFYDTYPRVEEAFAARLDTSLAPRAPSVLLQVVRELDLRPDSRVLDVGCGEGGQAFRLATHFGFRVLGLDPVQRHLDLAREARRDQHHEVASRVSFERGSATAIPVPDASVELVWCRDVMVHEPDPVAAYAEFARVLRPGGFVAAYQTVATPLLAPDEAEWLFDVMGVVPSSADPAVIDRRDRALGAARRRHHRPVQRVGRVVGGGLRPGRPRPAAPGPAAARPRALPRRVR